MAGGDRQAERSEATRRVLIAAAREQFAEHGFADASIEEIVRRGSLTRGALYHHFESKRDLFRAVHAEVEQELGERAWGAAAEGPAETHLEVGATAFLDACLDPAVQRIVLLDAPSVLGWEEWHALDPGRAAISAALERAMQAGTVEPQPIAPLALLVSGALNAAALAIARADDLQAARGTLGFSVLRLLDGLGPVD